MKNDVYKVNEIFESNYKTIRAYKRAQRIAWAFFIGVGLLYIALTIIIQF